MGLRSFAAKRLTKFLLQHGDLDEQLRVRAELMCIERTRGASVSLSSFAVQELQLVSHHSVILCVASLIITHCLRKEREARKKRLSWISSAHGRSLRFSYYAVNGISLALARVASCLAALLVAEIVIVPWSSWYPRASRELLEKYLFASSFWSILVSVLLAAASAIWSVLDPWNTSINNSTSVRSKTAATKKKLSWRDGLSKACGIAYTTALAASVVAILCLAHIHLPLFGHALRNEIDLGLPPKLSQALNQVLSSFFAFCVYSKLFPRLESSGQVPEGTRNTQKYTATDPVLLQRMSTLAQEARERVEARKRNKKPLRRISSEGNFGNFKTSSDLSASLTTFKSTAPAKAPQERRQSMPALSRSGTSMIRRRSSRGSLLASLPEHAHEESKEQQLSNRQWQDFPPDHSPNSVILRDNYNSNSPLRDIHMAGPTLSSTELLVKLKTSRSMKRSLSVPQFVDEDPLSF